MTQGYPHLLPDLAVRLSLAGSQIRRLERVDDIVHLGGSAHLFLGRMNGLRSFDTILDEVVGLTGVDRAALAADLDELWAGLLQRNLAASASHPESGHEHPFLDVVADEIRSTIHIDITHRCNEKCIHCLVPRDGHETTLEQVHDVARQAARLGFVGLAFSGGEPTLHREFWDMLQLSRELGFYFTIFTNGLTLGDDGVGRLAGFKPEQVRISIYSMNPEVHDAMTLIPGSFVRTMRSILGLKEAGIPIYINSPITNRNFDDFHAIAAFCAEHGFERNLDPVVQPTRDRTNFHRDLQLSYEQAKEVTGFQQDADELVVNVQAGAPVCNVGDDPSIDALLNVYPCPGLRLVLGNLREQSLEQLVLRHPRLPELRELSLDNLQVCQMCNVRDGCYRCHGHAYQERGDYTACAAMDRRQARIRRELMVERGTRKA